MKTNNIPYSRSLFITIVLALLVSFPAQAQLSDKGYATIDWQFNIPLNNHFADNASGWGMNMEGGYFVTPQIGIGLFLSYHTNHEYIPRQTFRLITGDVTTDQQHTLFQLPFGASIQYQWNRGQTIQPYVGAKLGAEYAKARSNFAALEARDNCWGFYASPEIGIHLFPWCYSPGLHAALYYSYGSNKARLLHYHVGGLSNFGFRLGVSF